MTITAYNTRCSRCVCWISTSMSHASDVATAGNSLSSCCRFVFLCGRLNTAWGIVFLWRARCCLCDVHTRYVKSSQICTPCVVRPQRMHNTPNAACCSQWSCSMVCRSVCLVETPGHASQIVIPHGKGQGGEWRKILPILKYTNFLTHSPDGATVTYYIITHIQCSSYQITLASC